MIKSERQYQITREMLTKFEDAVDQLEHRPSPSDPTDPSYPSQTEDTDPWQANTHP